MKRIKYLVPLIVAVIVLLLCGTIAGDRFIQETKRKQIYEDAVTVLEQLEDEEVDSKEMSKAIILTISNAKYVEPKNIIYMIGDGMGLPIVEATEAVYGEQLHEGPLAMYYLPIQSSQTTYSMFNEITDSAAWGPALTTYNKILFAEGNYVPSEDYKLKNRFV